MPKISSRSHCPIAWTLDLIGDKWTLLVLRDLLLGKHSFDEFLQSEEHIATNILAARLNYLCRRRLVRREKDRNDRRRITYSLTSNGYKLRPLVRAIALWGLDFFPGTKTLVDLGSTSSR